jgi:hypothetical protein
MVHDQGRLVAVYRLPIFLQVRIFPDTRAQTRDIRQTSIITEIMSAGELPENLLRFLVLVVIVLLLGLVKNRRRS